MSYQLVKNSRKNLKERCVYVMGGVCQLCGYHKTVSALEFHHIDPEQKDFAIGHNTNVSWGKARNEIKKCALLCANCHREVHSGEFDFQLYSPFDEEKAREIDLIYQKLKTHEIVYCKYCGKEISRDARTQQCRECYEKNIQIEKENKHNITRELLKDLIRTKPFTHIGKMYGVSDNAVRKWCDKYGLPRSSKEIKSYSDEQWELI